MPSRPFRFVHASDFHLERIPAGLAELPDHVRQLFVDAAYRATERVFDTALKEQVDAVLLAGDVVNPTTAPPRALVFLIEQFARLQAAGIQVYWAGGRVDRPGEWPGIIELPGNVHTFPDDRVEHVVHQRDGEPLFEVVGIARGPRKAKLATADFRPGTPGVYCVALAYGLAKPEAMVRQGVNYWALGGRHGRRTMLTTPCVAHYPGTPQGRTPDEAGPRGCTLVHVDADGKARTSFVPTDVVRWHQETVAVGDRTTRAALERLLDERATALWNGALGPDLLVQWTLSGAPAVAEALRRGKLAADLLGRLRNDFGHKRPALWSVSIAAEGASNVPEDLYAHESILGEFLRTLREYETHPDQPLDLAPYLAERHLAGGVATAARLDDPQMRTQALREAARLGVDLLSGEEAST